MRVEKERKRGNRKLRKGFNIALPLPLLPLLPPRHCFLGHAGQNRNDYIYLNVRIKPRNNGRFSKKFMPTLKID